MAADDQTELQQSTAFNTRPDLQDVLDDTRIYVSTETAVAPDAPQLPRYGMLSLLARDTPAYVYTHPAIAAVCDTAFTEGFHVFFYGPFLETLLQSEHDNPGKLECVPILLHELSHMLYGHHQRMQSFPQEVRLIAGDTSINPRIAVMMREQHQSYGPIFGGALGMHSEAEMQRYRKLSEEQIARELMLQRPPQPSSPKANGTPADGASRQFGASGDCHTLSIKELLEIFERHPDLNYVKKLLELPDSADRNGIHEIEQGRLARIAQKVSYAKSLIHQYGNRYPGRHVDEYAIEILDSFSKPKIEWKANIRDFVGGHGTQVAYSQDYPGKLFYVDPGDMNLPSEVYVGSHIPARPDFTVLMLVDTSYSVDLAMLRDLFSEVLGAVQRPNGIGEAIALCADTVIRDEPFRLTPQNVGQFLSRLRVSGRGGTDFATPIQQARRHPALQKHWKRLRALIYFTDLGAAAPARSELPIDLPPMAFVTVPGCFSRSFAHEVGDYARVIEIRTRTTIDLDTLYAPIQRPPSPKPKG